MVVVAVQKSIGCWTRPRSLLLKLDGRRQRKRPPRSAPHQVGKSDAKLLPLSEEQPEERNVVCCAEGHNSVVEFMDSVRRNEALLYDKGQTYPEYVTESLREFESLSI